MDPAPGFHLRDVPQKGLPVTAPDPRLDAIKDRLSRVPTRGGSAFVGIALPANAIAELWNLRQVAREDAAHLLSVVEAQAGQLAKVRELAEEWRYKGEFGWGAWQEGHGPDPEGTALDHASSQLRAALAPEGPEA